MLAATALCQDGGPPLPVNGPTPPRPATDNLAGLSPAGAHHGEVYPPLGLAPDCWPPPCSGAESYDPTQSCCPNRGDFFLFPPRLDWYAVADGVALRRNPTGGVDFAATEALPTGGGASTNCPVNPGL